MRTVEGFLSRRAQSIWPRALVYHDDRTAYVLEAPGTDPVGLGKDFTEARRAVEAMVRANKAGHDAQDGAVRARWGEIARDVHRMVGDFLKRRAPGRFEESELAEFMADTIGRRIDRGLREIEEEQNR